MKTAKKDQIAINLDTYSLASNAAIASIGAVRFNRNEIVDTFYTNVMATEHKFDINEDTLLYHYRFGKEWNEELTYNAVSIEDALENFKEWFGIYDIPVWSFNSSFHNVILRNAYKICEIDWGWKFYNDRDYSTIRNVLYLPIDSAPETPYNSLKKAEMLANKVIEILRS